MRSSEQSLPLNGPMLARLRKCASDTSPNWDGQITIYPPEACGLVALIDEPRPNHVITIEPSSEEPDFLDWSCSCGEVSGFIYGEFGRAADGAAHHVPPDQTLVITRPKSIEDGAA